MKSISVSRLGLAFLLLSATACVGVTNSMTADNLGEGKTQFAVSPSYVRLVGEGGSGGFMGGVQAQVLHGTSNTTDIGGRLSYQRVFITEDGGGDFGVSGFGAEFLARTRLHRSDKLTLALAPSFGFNRITLSSLGDSAGTNALQAKLPLLLGVPVGEHQFVGSVAVSDALFFGEGDSTNTINVGATVGFAARLPGTSVRVMPELGFLYPLIGSTPGSGSSFNDSGSFVLQFSVGLMFGGGSGGGSQSDDDSGEQSEESDDSDDDSGDSDY
ncbi:MAG TPA: hypothetical protein VF815_27105 [Myxococcaceae bacterium]|jgi:hypothetical protein